MYLLTVAWIDDSSSRSIELGVIPHPTRATQRKSWQAIPAAPDRTNYFVELRDETQWLEETKSISKETVEALLGEPAAVLLAREQQSTFRPVGEPNRKPQTMKKGKAYDG